MKYLIITKSANLNGWPFDYFEEYMKIENTCNKKGRPIISHESNGNVQVGKVQIERNNFLCLKVSRYQFLLII